MRKGRCGEYSAPQSAPLQSAVQLRPWARTTLDLELLKPPSSLSLSLSLLTQGGLRPVLERPIGWRMTRGCGGWWGGAPGAVSTPNLLLDDAPPGAAASSSTVTSIQQQALSPANTAAPIASYTPLFRMHLDLFRKGDFWTGLCSFSFCKCR